MSQQQRETVARILRGAPVDLAGDPAEQRELFRQMIAGTPVPEDVIVRPGVLGGVPTVGVEIAGTEPAGTLVHFHGGCFVVGSAEASVGLAADLARRAGVRVISVDYRLAPENPYPAAVDDALAVYRALLDEADGDTSGIAVSGESAGGNLAVALMLAARREGLPQPAGAALLSPWTDLTVPPTYADTGADPVINAQALRIRAADYLAGADPKQGSISPVLADLRGLAPLLIQAGSAEYLVQDAVRLAARAAADHVEVVLDVTPEVLHVFQAFAAVLDEGAAALDRAGEFLRRHLDATAAESAR
jgi:acetyl esterase/lipase